MVKVMFKVLLCDHECKYGPASNDLAMRYLRQNRYKSDKCLREDNDRDVPAVIEDPPVGDHYEEVQRLKYEMELLMKITVPPPMSFMIWWTGEGTENAG